MKNYLIFTIGQRDMQVLSKDGNTAYRLNEKEMHKLNKEIKNGKILTVWKCFKSGAHRQVQEQKLDTYDSLLVNHAINVTFPLLEKVFIKKDTMQDVKDIYLVYTDRSNYTGKDGKIKEFVEKEAFYTAEIVRKHFDELKKHYKFDSLLHLVNVVSAVDQDQYNLTKESAFQWADRWIKASFIREVKSRDKIFLALSAGMPDISRYCEILFQSYFPDQIEPLQQEQEDDVRASRIQQLLRFNDSKKEILARVKKFDFHGALSLRSAFTNEQRKSADKGFKLIDLACKWMDQEDTIVDKIIQDMARKYATTDDSETNKLLKLMKQTNINDISKSLIRYHDLLGRSQYVYAGVVLVSMTEKLSISLFKKLDSKLFAGERYNRERLQRWLQDYFGGTFNGRVLNLYAPWNFGIGEFMIEGYRKEKEAIITGDEESLLEIVKYVFDATKKLRDERNEFIHKGEGFAQGIIDAIQNNKEFWSIVFNSLKDDSIQNPDWRVSLAQQAKKSLEQMEHCLFKQT